MNKRPFLQFSHLIIYMIIFSINPEQFTTKLQVSRIFLTDMTYIYLIHKIAIKLLGTSLLKNLTCMGKLTLIQPKSRKHMHCAHSFL